MNLRAVLRVADLFLDKSLREQIAVFSHGTLEQVAPPLEVYHRPRTRFVGEFIGSARGQRLRMRIAGAQPDAVREGATLTVGWRPGDEHLIARS